MFIALDKLSRLSFPIGDSRTTNPARALYMYSSKSIAMLVFYTYLAMVLDILSLLTNV